MRNIVGFIFLFLASTLGIYKMRSVEVDRSPDLTTAKRKYDARLEREAIVTYSEQDIPPKYLSIRVVTLTGYPSIPGCTDSRPFETANGEHVRWGGCAMNGVPFGAILEIPDFFPGQYFVVNDRKRSRYDSTWTDVWFASKDAADQFGIRKGQMRILNPKNPQNKEIIAYIASKKIEYRDAELARTKNQKQENKS